MNKKLVIISMCIAIIVMTIGYSAFVSNIKINGTANITSTWNILFTKIEQVSIKGGAVEKTPPEATGTLATFDIGLISPGDEIKYQITVENKGSLNAIINKINATQLGSDAIEFIIDGIKEGDKLPHGEKTTFTVTIKYKEEVTKDPNLKDNELQIDITYVQDLSDKEQKDPSIVPTRLSQKILYDNEEKADTGINFGEISSESNGNGLYYTNKNTEDNRVTYYFRGAVDNNYVSFGGFYWRIVRINEDGSIRLIYQGKNPTDTGSNATIGSSAFNTMPGDNAFVGYMHGKPTIYTDGYSNYSGWTFTSTTVKVKMSQNYTFNQETGLYTLSEPIEDAYYDHEHINYYTCWGQRITCAHMIKITSTSQTENRYGIFGGEMHAGYWSTSYEEAHANEVNSAIKTKLEDWYGKNLINFDSYLADTGFCNDRNLSTGTGFGRQTTYYGSTGRLSNNSKEMEPQFACPNPAQDLFTVSNNKGNKKSTQKVGLITADEMSYAGGVYNVANNSYYLYIGVDYFTMSPFFFLSSGSYVQNWYVYSNGYLRGAYLWNALGVRPVINLLPTIEITDINQDGTIDNPYIIKM